MSDTNDMRREFEVWYSQTFDDQCVWDEARNCYVEIGCHLAWKGWQAATERAAALQWQPIETVPKDGTRVLLVIDHGEHGDKIWTGLWADGWLVSYGKPQNTPIHWMPLPPPPAIRQGGDT